jgi:hypothetical protein
MENEVIESKFKEGDQVYALSQPHKKLTVRRYFDKLYYCYITDAPGLKELVYGERDLAPEKIIS